MVDRAYREQYSHNGAQYSNRRADAKPKREPSDKRAQNHCPIDLHGDASDLKELSVGQRMQSGLPVDAKAVKR
jgi:hypothetical protein